MLKILDLFSGIGGFSYAAEVLVGGYKTIGFCEYDKKCQEVLKLRFPGVPIYPDIRELNEETLADTESARIRTKPTSSRKRKGAVSRGESEARLETSPFHADIITGGYPCQPFSQAGKRGGENDDRHLWPEMFRVIQLVKPKYVICENVSGHISMGLDSVLSDLESEGYTTEVFVLPACAVDAKHRRDRVWIMAYARNSANRTVRGQEGETHGIQGDCGATGYSRMPGRTGGNGEDVADTSKQGLEGCSQAGNTGSKGQESGNEYSGGCDRGRGSKWPVEPSVGRVAHGIPNRVDRLKQLGNSIVPQVAAQLFRAIKEIENELA